MTTQTTVTQFFELITQGRVHEIRTLASDKKVRSYYPANSEAAGKLADSLPEHVNAYVSLNHSDNPPKGQQKGCDIARIKTVGIDVDAVRPDTSRPATDDQNQAACDLAAKISEHLISEGITPVCVANTGNGAMIVIRADMATKQQPQVVGLLNTLAAKFNSDVAKVDTCVSDLSRVIRLVGTSNYKTSPATEDGDDFSRPSYLIKVYDSPTVVTDLSKYASNQLPILTQSYQPCANPTRGLRTTLPFAEIVELFRSRGCTVEQVQRAGDVFDELTSRQSFVIKGCPVRGPQHSDSDTFIYLINGRLYSKCFHSKCACKTIFDVIAAIGIRPSELSTFYPDRVNNRSLNLIEALGDSVESVTDTEIKLTKGDTITVTETGPCFATTDKEGTMPLATYLKVNHQLRTTIYDSIWGANRQQIDSDRLATEIAQTMKVVRMQDELYIFNVDGYEKVKVADLLTPSIQQVVNSDTETLMREWGVDAHKPNVKKSVVGDVTGHFLAKVRTVDHFGVNFSGDGVDLTRIANHPNGIWLADLNRLVPHSPDYFIRKAVSFDYVEGGKAPVFDKWLAQILPEREQQQLAKEWLGCIMTGDRLHQKFLILFGEKRAGKGTLVGLATQLVGEQYAAGVNAKTLSYEFGLAGCLSKLLIHVNEVKGLNADQISFLKSVTGNDKQQLSRKFADSFDGWLQNNWVLSTNLNPEFEDASTAVMSRISALTFNHSFLGREDRLLPDKLESELPAIAAQAREAYRGYKTRMQFSENPHSNDLLENIQEATSPIAPFVSAHCVLRPGARVLMSEVYAAYKANYPDGLTSNQFGRELRNHCQSIKRAPDKKHYEHIELR